MWGPEEGLAFLLSGNIRTCLPTILPFTMIPTCLPETGVPFPRACPCPGAVRVRTEFRMPQFVIFVWQQWVFFGWRRVVLQWFGQGTNGTIQEDGTEECGNWNQEPGVMLPNINLGRVAIICNGEACLLQFFLKMLTPTEDGSTRISILCKTMSSCQVMCPTPRLHFVDCAATYDITTDGYIRFPILLQATILPTLACTISMFAVRRWTCCTDQLKGKHRLTLTHVTSLARQRSTTNCRNACTEHRDRAMSGS